MKSTFKLIVLIFLVAGCSQKTSDAETSGTAGDSVVSTPAIEPAKQEAVPAVDPKEVGKIELNEANLMEFSFMNTNGYEFTFAGDGKFTLSTSPEAEQIPGTWQLSGSSIKVAIDSDTISFEVKSFKETAMDLVTTKSSGGKLMGEIEREGYYYSQLHRLIYSFPFQEEQFTGGWQAREGACSFTEGGDFTFGAADCSVEGRWKFDGKYISTKFTRTECGWADPFDKKLEVIRLAAGLMMVKNSQDGTEIYTR